jgi:hypothetical protein
MSDTGQIIPHHLIFPRAKINKRPTLNAPAEAVTVVQQNGWMNSINFLLALKLKYEFFYVLFSHH